MSEQSLKQDANVVNYFAIVPAAGASQRMGTSKLMLPWPTEIGPRDTVLDAVLRAWTASGLERIVVVLRAEDQGLQRVCAAWPVDVEVAATPPADMKASVGLGIRRLQRSATPNARDYCCLAPADVPGLRADVIRALIAAPAPSDHVRSPLFGEKSGHPAVFPWQRLEQALDLPEHQGIDALVKASSRTRVQLPEEWYSSDLDTPTEYERALALLKKSEGQRANGNERSRKDRQSEDSSTT